MKKKTIDKASLRLDHLGAEKRIPNFSVRHLLLLGWINTSDATPRETRECLRDLKHPTHSTFASSQFFNWLVSNGLAEIIGSDGETANDAIYKLTEAGLSIARFALKESFDAESRVVWLKMMVKLARACNTKEGFINLMVADLYSMSELYHTGTLDGVEVSFRFASLRRLKGTSMVYRNTSKPGLTFKGRNFFADYAKIISPVRYTVVLPKKRPNAA